MGTRTLRLTLTAVFLLVSSRTGADGDRSREPVDRDTSEVASAWFETLYDIVKAERAPPPQASRIYGITAVALYESIVAGAREHRSLVGQLNGLTSLPRPQRNKKYHWPAVANAAVAATVRGLYAAMSQASAEAIDELERTFATEQSEVVNELEHERSVELGLAVSAGVLAWAATDGFAALNNCPYVAAPVPGAWRPTPPLFSPSPLQPCWGMLRPMVLSQGECPAPPPPQFSTDIASAFHAAAQEVYDVGRALTGEQKMIADFWSDGTGATGTPPGHWIALVSQIARNNDLSLEDAAEAYARVGIAVHDAFIVCWREKYIVNLQRPVTYINDHIDAGWLPYLVTPVFPSYTSGHSTQSGAAAVVLTELFGITPFTDTTHTEHGLLPPQEPRTFGSFAEAAAEAAMSRLYGGIHYSFDNVEGLAAGQCVGRAIGDRVRFKRDPDPHRRR
jgi:membrane-associated phospholipid phosphatase